MNRRRFFGLLPAVGAMIALPSAAAIGEVLPSRKVVKPLLLERVCDGNFSKYYDGPEYRGCGTVFQWYLGTSGYPVCPNCGTCYVCTSEDLKSSRFAPKE